MAEQSHAYPRVTYNIPYAISVFRDLKGDFALNTITPARENRSQAVLNAATVPCHLLRDRDDVNHAVSSFLESPWLAKHKLRARSLSGHSWIEHPELCREIQPLSKTWQVSLGPPSLYSS